MIDRKRFYDTVRPLFTGRRMSKSQVDGMEAVLVAYEQKYSRIGLKSLAYCFATDFHETAQTMQPIEEYGKGRGRDYGRKVKMNRQPYIKPDKLYYGRGLVQLTWYENYEKAGKLIGVDLLNNPELACTMSVAVDVMFLGMEHGWFTGRRLSQYFDETKTNWQGARAIINGRDKAVLIAGYAQVFYNALK